MREQHEVFPFFFFPPFHSFTYQKLLITVGCNVFLLYRFVHNTYAHMQIVLLYNFFIQSYKRMYARHVNMHFVYYRCLSVFTANIAYDVVMRTKI